MSPRPYKLGQRQASVDQTRAAIVTAARELVASEGGFAEFTVDAVARQALVARMTVYYQFGSKRGLLEAVFDDLAKHGLVERLRASFTRSEPFQALAELIGAFVGFWASDRTVIRRLRSLAGLDPDVERAIRARDARRRDALGAILGRIAKSEGPPGPRSREDTLDILHTLTSFETFDALAVPPREPEDVATLLIGVAHSVLGLS